MGRRNPRRIAAAHRNGISHYDLSVIGEGVGFLQRHGVGVHVSVNLFGIPEHLRHRVFDMVKGRIATYQKRSGMKRVYWLSVRETITEQGYSLHLHLICVFPDLEWSLKFADSLNNSTTFKKLGEKAVCAKPVTEPEHWFKLQNTYFTQETTIQAWHSANRTFVKPCHPETGKASFPLDSDRVGASQDLKAALVRTGAIRDWTRTNAKRCSTALVSGSMSAAKPVTVSVFMQPEQLPLPLDAPPVNVLALVEAKRQELHLPQHVVASQLGGLKQAGYANALRGHDRLGAWRRNRALAWLAAA